MQKLSFARVTCIILPSLAVFASVTVASADPIVNGTLTPGEFGPMTATVGYDPSAPTGNFQSPSNVAQVGYSIYMTATDGYLYGAFQTSGLLGGANAQNFANLYFDLDPQNNNGSDLGFEMSPTGILAFIPGVDGTVTLTNVQYASVRTATSSNSPSPTLTLKSDRRLELLS